MEKALKYKRSTTEQLDIYLRFVREHPEIQSSRSYQRNPRRMDILWNMLAEKLNAVKGPTRTPKKWKETMTHRKNQLLCRERKNNKADKFETGEGLSRMDELSSFEQRSMETVGKADVGGGPSRVDGFSSFEHRSMETVGNVDIGGGPSRMDGFSSFEQRSIETVGKVEVGGGPSRIDELNAFTQKSMQTVSNVFDGLTNSTWLQQSEGTLETEYDEESMGDGPSAINKPQPQKFEKVRKHRSAHKNSNKLMKETFNTLNNILKTQQVEEDDCDLYGRLLAKKLRQYTPFERQELMHEIDGILIKRNRRRLNQPVMLYDTLR